MYDRSRSLDQSRSRDRSMIAQSIDDQVIDRYVAVIDRPINVDRLSDHRSTNHRSTNHRFQKQSMIASLQHHMSKAVDDCKIERQKQSTVATSNEKGIHIMHHDTDIQTP